MPKVKDMFHHAKPRFQELQQANGYPTTEQAQTLDQAQAGFVTGGMSDCTCLVVHSSGDNPKIYGQHGGGGTGAINVRDFKAKLLSDGNTGPVNIQIIPGPDNWKGQSGPDPEIQAQLQPGSADVGNLINAEKTDIRALVTTLNDIGRPVTFTLSDACHHGPMATITPDMTVNPGVPPGPYKVVRPDGKMCTTPSCSVKSEGCAVM